MKVEASRSDQVGMNQPVSLRVQDRQLLLVRTAAGLFALADRCPHAGLSLADGNLGESSITCKHHGVQIDLKTGAVLWSMGFLNLEPVVSYPVDEAAGIIRVDLPDG